MAGGAALITGLTGMVGAGAAAMGGRASGFTVARVAADAIRLHVVTQLVVRDVEGDEDAAKAIVVSLRERVANLGAVVAALAERYEAVRAQLDAKQAELDTERQKRQDAEARTSRLLLAAERLKERVTGPDDEEVQALLSELEQIDADKKAATDIAAGITTLADDLEDAA